jgi:alginate O-acetyltransferase complex protein AlgI
MNWLSAGATTRPVGIELNSWAFLLFAAVAVLVFRSIRRPDLRHGLLLAFNLCFFLQFTRTADALLVLGGLLAVTWALARLRAGSPQRLAGGLLLAVVLAYWAFLFMIKDPQLAGLVNPFRYHPVAIIGISYMVFRCIAVVMDADALPPPGLLELINHVLFFPTLLAGPIERYERFREFHDGTDLDLNESPLPALHRIANGLIKKFILADGLAPLAASAYIEGPLPATGWLWVGVLLLPVLLYLDFSGYCDIVIGLVRLMGFRLAENFDRPWLARNIQDFWNRWHITLSHFIRDYVFTPINYRIAHGVSPRWQFPLVVAAYLLTMLLIALWHATTWGFLVFGLMHGAALVAVLLWRRYGLPRVRPGVRRWLEKSPISVTLSRLMTFVFVSISMLFWIGGVRRGWEMLRALVGG